MRLPLWVGAALLLLAVQATAQEGIHKCVQADGLPLYSDQPCAVAERNLALSLSDYASFPPQLRDAARLWYERAEPLLRGLGAPQWLALVYGLLSLSCFLAYYRDKQAAIQGRRRTPEARLHLYELLGGWPGGLLAQRLLRHKNRKLGYQLKFWLIVLLHLLALGLGWLYGPGWLLT